MSVAFHFFHAARRQRDRNGHSLRDIVQTDDDRHRQAADAAACKIARIRRADDHTLGEIMQCDRERHDKARQKELSSGLLLSGLFILLFVFFVMIAVDQFGELIGRLGVLFVDMLDFRIGLFVNNGIEEVDHAEADDRHADHKKDIPDRSGRLAECVRQKIEADDAEHHAARKT